MASISALPFSARALHPLPLIDGQTRMFLFQKPLLPSHYSVWFEPPDESGDEVLRIVSERRSLKLKGHSFREFHRCVVPLLDGKHTMEEICRETTDIFDAEDLDAALRMLAAQGIVIEGATATMADGVAERLMPQLNYFHEMTEEGRNLQARLTAAKVAVIGLGGAGAATALSLAASGVGKLIAVDDQPLTPPDIYLSPIFGTEEIGRNRAESLEARVRSSAPQVETSAISARIETEDELWRSIEGSDFVVCCLDAGMLNLAYKLNKVCMRYGVRWISAALEGAEVVVGPAFDPHSGPCYMCYRMRSVACASNPNASFAFERYLDRKKTDLSGRRENLVFGAGIVANMLGVEVMKALTGSSEPSLVGRLLTVNLQDLSTQKHTVLQKPWCPTCMEREPQ